MAGSPTALPDAVTAHREHRDAWYADLVGPLLVPASSVDALTGLLDPADRLAIGIIGDLPIDRLGLPDDPRVVVRQVEAAVAKRGEDPQPGIARILEEDDAAPIASEEDGAGETGRAAADDDDVVGLVRRH